MQTRQLQLQLGVSECDYDDHGDHGQLHYARAPSLCVCVCGVCVVCVCALCALSFINSKRHEGRARAPS